MHQEYFSLIHTDFNKDLVSSLSDYFTETSLTDVTLVSDEQIQFKAHKFVLSASSPVMKDLLLSNPHSHPLIYLRGVKQQELLSILQFMYLGEANVQNNQIKKFLDVAKDFELRVLPQSSEMFLKRPDESSSNESDIQIYNDTKSNLSPDFETLYNAVGENISEDAYYENETIITPFEFSDFNQCSDGLQKPLTFKHKADGYKSKQHQSEQNVRYSCNQCDYQAIRSNKLKRHQESKHEGQRYSCNQCGYQATRPDNLKRHQELKHEESKQIVSYSCNRCEYQATQLGDLKRHERWRHEGLRNSCNQCEYAATRPDNLKRHQDSKHRESKHQESKHQGAKNEESKENVQYACNQCEYKATRQCDLKRHEKSKHRESNGEQSRQDVGYSCNKCEYHTKEESKLEKHHQVKHEDIVYYCNQCQYRTEFKIEFSEHRRSKHTYF